MRRKQITLLNCNLILEFGLLFYYPTSNLLLGWPGRSREPLAISGLSTARAAPE